ncbi:unnamed protein product, partial [Polarella glacialis]
PRLRTPPSSWGSAKADVPRGRLACSSFGLDQGALSHAVVLAAATASVLEALQLASASRGGARQQVGSRVPRRQQAGNTYVVPVLYQTYQSLTSGGSSGSSSRGFQRTAPDNTNNNNLINNNNNSTNNNSTNNNNHNNNNNNNPNNNSSTARRDPRPYQEEVMRSFFSHAEECARQARPVRIQMACGTGKTFVYGMIISKDLREHPGSRYVVFVPWRDLAHQTAAELASFGLRTEVMGDGKKVLPTSGTYDVLVCVYASVHHLEGLNFRIKIVDEAHHIGSYKDLAAPVSSSQGYKKYIRAGIKAELAVDFSATFRGQEDLAFSYDLAQATGEGFVSDFVVTTAFFSGGDGISAISQLVKQHPEWAPMFVVFNTKRRARQCTEKLVSEGIPTAFMDGSADQQLREQTKIDLRAGLLQVVCVVGLFNEGTSIDELRTVVFADKRHSQVNIKQVAMRVTRRHASKMHGNVVLIDKAEDHVGDHQELKSLVRALLELKPNLAEQIQQKNSQWVRAVMPRGPGRPVEETAEAWSILVGLNMWDSVGNFLATSGLDLFEFHFQSLGDFVKRHSRLPRRAVKEETERRLANWLVALRRRLSSRTLSAVHVKRLQLLHPLVEKWMRKKVSAELLLDSSEPPGFRWLRQNLGIVPEAAPLSTTVSDSV